MGGYVLFQMDQSYRRFLISGHEFYIAQARKRLLSQFDNLEEEADRAADEWLERQSQWFDPDRHDPADAYEGAYEYRIEFYGMLSDMRDSTRLSVVSGMFHEWEKKLREWLARQVGFWHREDDTRLAIWKAKFSEIFELLTAIGWNPANPEIFSILDACRLVVNVYKHGDGTSFKNLKDKYPEYLPDPLQGAARIFPDQDCRDHTHLKVSDQQISRFSNAIIEFWKTVPAEVREEDITSVPGWFDKALLKDKQPNERTRS